MGIMMLWHFFSLVVSALIAVACRALSSCIFAIWTHGLILTVHFYSASILSLIARSLSLSFSLYLDCAVVDIAVFPNIYLVHTTNEYHRTDMPTYKTHKTELIFRVNDM